MGFRKHGEEHTVIWRLRNINLDYNRKGWSSEDRIKTDWAFGTLCEKSTYTYVTYQVKYILKNDRFIKKIFFNMQLLSPHEKHL